jgi:hypothetical protein
MKYIWIKLTDQQHWELKTLVTNKIVRLQEQLLKKEAKVWRDEIAFQKRLLATLSKGKIPTDKS